MVSGGKYNYISPTLDIDHISVRSARKDAPLRRPQRLGAVTSRPLRRPKSAFALSHVLPPSFTPPGFPLLPRVRVVKI